jgi:hypothetical protein
MIQYMKALLRQSRYIQYDSNHDSVVLISPLMRPIQLYISLSFSNSHISIPNTLTCRHATPTVASKITPRRTYLNSLPRSIWPTMSTRTPNTCSIVSPCRLCASKLEEYLPCTTSSLATRGNRPRPAPMSLPQIEAPDPNDLVAVKRMNNTMAARKSRQRQIDKLARLERTVEELAAERNHWKNWAEFIQQNWESLIEVGMNSMEIYPQWIAVENTPVNPLKELIDMAR